MFILALGVAVLDTHTRLTRLETSAPLFAAVGTTDYVDLVHTGVKSTKRDAPYELLSPFALGGDDGQTHPESSTRAT
jgi:hypothetical protein